MFYVGQRVECVESGYAPGYPHDLARVGAVYTVSRVFAAPCGTLALELVELHQPEDDLWWPGTKAACFRPLVERKTDISIFTRMLTPNKQGVDA